MWVKECATRGELTVLSDDQFAGRPVVLCQWSGNGYGRVWKRYVSLLSFEIAQADLSSSWAVGQSYADHPQYQSWYVCKCPSIASAHGTSGTLTLPSLPVPAGQRRRHLLYLVCTTPRHRSFPMVPSSFPVVTLMPIVSNRPPLEPWADELQLSTITMPRMRPM